MSLSAKALCPLLALAVVVAPATPVRARDCLGPPSVAYEQKRFQATVEAVEKVRTDADCADVRVDLDMLRALALERMAERDGGARWCTAREAYASLREVEDRDYSGAAAAAFERAAEHCPEAPPTPPAARPDPPDADPPTAEDLSAVHAVHPLDRQMLVGGGIAGALIGGLLVGFGVAAAVDADGMADVLDDEVLSDPDRAAEQLRAEGRATGLLIGGGVTAVAGIAALVWGLSLETAPPGAVGVGVSAGPAGLLLRGAF